MICNVSVVFFDSDELESHKDNIAAIFESLGFSSSVTSTDKRTISIPQNMYIGNFEGEGRDKIREDLTASIKEKLAELGIKIKYMLMVSERVSWGIRHV